MRYFKPRSILHTAWRKLVSVSSCFGRDRLLPSITYGGPALRRDWRRISTIEREEAKKHPWSRFAGFSGHHYYFRTVERKRVLDNVRPDLDRVRNHVLDRDHAEKAMAIRHPPDLTEPTEARTRTMRKAISTWPCWNGETKNFDTDGDSK